MRLFLILAIIWWTWRLIEDMMNGASFGTTLRHYIFLLISFIVLILITER